MAGEYIQQLRRMMNEIEERREHLSDNEYLTGMNDCLRSYLAYGEEQCTCTDDAFMCYRYPRLLRNCRHKEAILEQAPLLAILIPGGQIPADFRLQMKVQYAPYDLKMLAKTMRYLFNLSCESNTALDKITCAISVFHLMFKHQGVLASSSKLRESFLRKLDELQTSEESLAVLDHFDYSVLGLSENPIPAWWLEAGLGPNRCSARTT